MVHQLKYNVKKKSSTKASIKPSHHYLTHCTVSCKVASSSDMAGLKQMTLFHALQTAGLVDIAPALLQNREYFLWADSVLGGIFIPHIDYKTKQSSCCLATPLE